MKSENSWDKVAEFTNKGSFSERLGGYLMFYIPVAFVYMILLYVSEVHFLKLKNPGMLIEMVLFFIFIMLPPSLPFVLWEMSIRKFRRKHGLSVYGNIREELEQMEIDERVKKEHKAFVNNGFVKDGVDKNDVGYWFGLLERGAITKEEYEAKKAELLK